MSKMNDEVLLAIVSKFLKGTEGFELIREEDYKNYIVYFAAYKESNENTNFGLPIYILIAENGKVRFADPDERDEIMSRNSEYDEEEDW